jgi:hypothetical protein
LTGVPFAVLLQGPAFNEQVASLQSELKLLKAANSQLTEDHKVSQQHDGSWSSALGAAAAALLMLLLLYTSAAASMNCSDSLAESKNHQSNRSLLTHF